MLEEVSAMNINGAFLACGVFGATLAFHRWCMEIARRLCIFTQGMVYGNTHD